MRHSVLLVGAAVMVNAANARCILKQLQFLKESMQNVPPCFISLILLQTLSLYNSLQQLQHSLIYKLL